MRLTDEQLALQETVAKLLAKAPDDLWPRLCEIGAAGLAIPEEYGGSDATLTELQIVLEQTGRTLAPVPLLATAIAAEAVLATNDEAACARLLPAIAAGQVTTWVAGTYVLDADRAEVLLVAAGGCLYEMRPDQVVVEGLRTMDESRHLATVTTEQLTGLIGPYDETRVRRFALSALAAEQVGTAARCLDMTVDYARQRVQFGRPIGSFQAVKHRLADMHVLVETARSAAYDLGHPTEAKIYCSEALGRVAAEMVQLHGGIAITWEHDAQRLFKRAHGAAFLFGHPAEHLRAYQVRG
ncbi:acyl-CoA dehydrogenase family protein [Kutzneria buriramensis]|uniref:Alkylation response protein AidB-like acyl-CoA dehydrogenase n=1 Tax=Kutzneria buriramensis TaxID=1045776 RepID=A0A3E0H225_9PSEU|nr:acyl-CoA dehydrogenase family protein [Kutzneria buriramensis]REH36324.1 alkylation response protein AidB-like acyl-CoA dehydrogenase [Kutzneria buriramensis]